MVIRSALALFWLLAVPVLAGRGLSAKKEYRFGDSLLAGLLFSYALAWLLTLLFTAVQGPLHILSWIYGGIMLAVALWGIRTFILDLKKSGGAAGLSHHTKSFLTKENLFLAAAIVLILVQVVIVFHYGNVDADDSFFVGMAAGEVETDTVFHIDPYTGLAYKTLPKRYVYAQYPTLLAMNSVLSAGMHPAVLAHTFYPVVLLPAAYLFLYMLGKRLFPGKREAQGIFLLLLAVMGWFSGYTQKNALNLMMIRLWQGKAVLAAILVPVLIYLGLTVMLEKEPAYPWYYLLMAVMGACLCSSLGVMIAPLILGCFGLLDLVRYRSIKRLITWGICVLPAMAVGILYVVR
ncbi:MAG: hypothetical protein IJX90_05365 [Blautia sp.]|nr:hypothetical protein [Blautia sp.]